MTLAGSIKQFVESIAKSARIVSPRFSDYKIESFDFYSEAADIDSSLRADVVKIIQDEIKLQLTEVKQGETETPSGSVESQIVSNVKKGIGVAKNPASLATDVIKFLPHAALVALAVSLVPLLLKELAKPGGLMDVRWKRQITEEINGFMDRQTKRNSQIGTRSIVIQSRAGFIGINGANNSNNLREIREGGVNKDRLARIDLKDHTKGLFN